jgi:phosphatidate phosphatase APP1
LAFLLLQTPLLHASDLKRDEEVVLFPTVACLAADGTRWSVPVHGIVFEPEADSEWRDDTVAWLASAVDVEPGTPEARRFAERTRAFLVDNESGKELLVRVGAVTARLPPSGADGHFRGTLDLPAAEPGAPAGGWLDVEIVAPRGDGRRFAGRVQLVPPDGVSVVSDIDDTVRISEVGDVAAVLENALLREFRAVPGMAPLYRGLADQGAVFHWVSGSPWQLHEPLAAFFAEEGFPAGSMHLKKVRVKDSSVLELVAAPEGLKEDAIGALLDAFPRRVFVLVGDSGERDPEVYGRLARRRGAQVAAIAIRAMHGATAADPRFAQAFEGLEPAAWRVFDEPDDKLAEFLRERIAAPR